MLDSVRDWAAQLFVKAIGACSKEQDRVDALMWLTSAREVLEDEHLGGIERLGRLYKTLSFSGVATGVLNGVAESVKSYKDSDLPLPVKLAVPVTLAAAAVVGGQAVGVAGFGTAVGAPVLLLVFLGVAGITSILEAFLGGPASQDYLSVVMALIVRDEFFRRARKDLQEAMQAEPAEPAKRTVPEDETLLKDALLAMDPFDFERHVMAFFQDKGIFGLGDEKK